MHVILKGMFYDEDRWSKSIQEQIVEYQDWLFYYDNSYQMLFEGTLKQCEEWLDNYKTQP